MRWRPQFPTCRASSSLPRTRLFADLEATGWLRVLLLLAAFVGFGYGCERVFRLATAGVPRAAHGLTAWIRRPRVGGRRWRACSTGSPWC